jgi:hypothetical protein
MRRVGVPSASEFQFLFRVYNLGLLTGLSKAIPQAALPTPPPLSTSPTISPWGAPTTTAALSLPIGSTLGSALVNFLKVSAISDECELTEVLHETYMCRCRRREQVFGLHVEFALFVAILRRYEVCRDMFAFLYERYNCVNWVGIEVAFLNICF